MANPLIKIGAIEGGSAAGFELALANCDPKQPVVLDIHSEGGSVFEGFRIGELLSEWKGKKIARVNVTAFSIASYIAMLCDEVEIKSVGWMMVHNPWTVAQGDDGDLGKQAEMLASLKESMVAAYCRKTGMSEPEVLALMKAETWLNADQAVELGFADRIVGSEKPATKAAAFASLFITPLSKKEPVAMSQADSNTPKAATPQEIKAAFPKASSDFVLNCLMQGLPMSSIAAQAAKSMEEENESLKSKLSAMEEKLEAAKAEYEEEKAKYKKAMEEKEEEAKARARRNGLPPLAQSPSGSVGGASAKARWLSVIGEYKAQGMSHEKAVLNANRYNPGLREEMIAEANVSAS